MVFGLRGAGTGRRLGTIMSGSSDWAAAAAAGAAVRIELRAELRGAGTGRGAGEMTEFGSSAASLLTDAVRTGSGGGMASCGTAYMFFSTDDRLRVKSCCTQTATKSTEKEGGEEEEEEDDDEEEGGEREREREKRTTASARVAGVAFFVLTYRLGVQWLALGVAECWRFGPLRRRLDSQALA